MGAKLCFYCGGKFYNHPNDIHWRVGNDKGDIGHLECWNEACYRSKHKTLFDPYNDLMNGIKSKEIDWTPIVRYESEARELEELETKPRKNRSVK